MGHVGFQIVTLDVVYIVIVSFSNRTFLASDLARLSLTVRHGLIDSLSCLAPGEVRTQDIISMNTIQRIFLVDASSLKRRQAASYEILSIITLSLLAPLTLQGTVMS